MSASSDLATFLRPVFAISVLAGGLAVSVRAAPAQGDGRDAQALGAGATPAHSASR